jgi:hypothetical protein
MTMNRRTMNWSVVYLPFGKITVKPLFRKIFNKIV